MPLDITALTGQWITPFRATSVNYPSNPRNAFVYDIKYLYHTYSDITLNLVARFHVIRSAMFNGNLEVDIEYDFDSIATMHTTVDKFGNIVDEFNPDGSPNSNAWGKEFDRIAILFNTPIADSQIVYQYQQELFDKGLFDRPKK